MFPLSDLAPRLVENTWGDQVGRNLNTTTSPVMATVESAAANPGSWTDSAMGKKNGTGRGEKVQLGIERKSLYLNCKPLKTGLIFLF